MNRLKSATLAAAAALLALAAHADEYPHRPIKIVVIVAPGGSGDIMARTVAEGLTARLGQPVVVENKPGAGGNLATQAVARAPADGYTLLLSANNHPLNPLLFANPGYSIDDLIPVAELMEGPSVISVPAASKFQTLADLLKAAREKPNTIAYGSAGIGLPSHIAVEMLQRAADVKLVHVAYRGSGPSIADAVGNQVPSVASTLVAAQPNIEGGKLRALAVTSAKRWPSAPHIPAASESGLPNYEHMTWLGLFAPKGTPAPVVTRLNTEIRALLASDSMRERVAKLGGVSTQKTVAEFDAMVKKEYVSAAKLVREANLKAE